MVDFLAELVGHLLQRIALASAVLVAELIQRLYQQRQHNEESEELPNGE